MKFFFIFFFQIFLFSKIKTENKKDLNFRGGFRIDSIFNKYSLTNENYLIQFFKSKDKAGQMFGIKKTQRNTYYIETKNSHKKLIVNQNGHVMMDFREDNKNPNKEGEWKIFKIEENQYVIQNAQTSNFMEINNNYLQCINKLPLPLDEHKSEIKDVFKFNFFRLYEEVEFTPEQLEKIEKEPIDVLIKYIDLSDKTLKREGIKQIQKDEDNEELRYSIRSILKYIPWVRKIFILMPNEKVRYFKPYDEIKEKIVYVKDKDLLGYDSANIYAFTFNLFKMEKFGLSENFIYFDDDFFVGKHLNKSHFFYYDEDEKRVVPSLLNSEFYELNRELTNAKYNMVVKKKDNMASQCFMAWILSLLSTEKFFMDHYKDLTIINANPIHNAISYNIKDLKEIYDLVSKNYQYANETLNSIERHILTLQTQHCVDLYELNIKKRKAHPIKYNVIPMNLLKLSYTNTELFAINTGGDRLYTEEEYKRQKELMRLRFPNPTPYEIPGSDDEDKDKDKKVDKKKSASKSGVKENENNNNEENNGVMVINNPEDSKTEQDNELQIKINILTEINQKQSLIIKTSNYLIILTIVLIVMLFYLYYKEKNKFKYNQTNDLDSKKRIEIID